MRILKAYFLLIVFVGSSFLANASVHFCGDEITSMQWFTKAECEHEKHVEISCHSHCCFKPETKTPNQIDKKDCCETQQLVSAADQLFQEVSQSKIKLVSASILYVFWQVYLLENRLVTEFYESEAPTVSGVNRSKLQVYII